MGTIVGMLASDGFVVVSKPLIKGIGLEAAVLLGELASEYSYWSKEGKLDDGWFYSTVENVQENTSLSQYQQSKAFSALERLGLVETRKKGIPPKRYVRFDEEALISFLRQLDQQKPKNSIIEGQKTLPLMIEELDPNNNNDNSNKKTNNNQRVIDEFAKSKELKNALADFVSMRRAIKKPMTPKAVQILVSKLGKLTSDESEMVLILQQSILHCWQSVYPLKEGNSNGSQAKGSGSLDELGALGYLKGRTDVDL